MTNWADPLVQPQPQQPPAVLSAGYYLARLPNDVERRKVARTIGDRVMNHVTTAALTAIKATTKPLDDDDFLRVIRLKPLELWMEQKAKFPGPPWPESFSAQMERWAKLAPVDPLRDAILSELERLP